MNFNESMKYPMNFSIIGLWIMVALWILSIVLILLTAPRTHTRLTDDLNPQSAEQLAQQLSAAIESKQLSQVMRLFHWEGVAIEDVHSMKALWQQTLAEEVLAQVDIMPVSRESGTKSQLANYYRQTISNNRHDTQSVINGELKIIFKARQGNGFLSTITMKLPYGEMNTEGGFRMYSVSLLDSPAVNSN